MPNPQLLEYIKNQLQLGVSREVIKAALLQAGWSGIDVSEAMAGTTPQESPPLSQAAKPGVSSSPITVDIFRPKEEPVFQPKREPAGNMPPAQFIGSTVESVSLMTPAAIPALSKEPRGRGVKILISGTILVAVAALGFAVWVNIRGESVAREVEGLAAAQAGLESRNAELVGEVHKLTTDVRALTGENKTLSLQLSFFAPSAVATTTPLVVRGTLGGGGKSAYNLTLDRGIVLTLKNGKDAAVESILKPTLGVSVEITGTYVPGSRDVTVTAVNGVEVKSD